MTFLLAAFREPALSGAFHEEWATQIRSFSPEPVRSRKVFGDNWRLHCTLPDGEPASHLWLEQGSSQLTGSLVYVSGWCYRSTSSSDRLSDEDHNDALARYRDGLVPLTTEHFGNFIAVVYDHVFRRVAVVPDRSAMSAVYFSEFEGGIVVSDRAVAVASLSQAVLDGHSVVALLRGIHIPFGRSLFGNVNRVMCGCYLDLDLVASRIEVRRWMPVYSPTLSLSLADCLEVSAAALCRVAERVAAPGGTVIDLTGGNDTRLLAAAVDAVHPRGLPDSVSWRVAGAPDSADVVIARRLAQATGWPLRVLDRYPPADTTNDHLERLALQADGAFTVDAAFGRTEQERRYSAASECLVGAIGGELLRGFFWRHEFLALGRTSEVNFRALLAYRLYDTNGIDPTRLSADAPSLAEHDEVLLHGYRALANAGGERLNPYKLDVMYLHKLCYSAGNSHSWLRSFRHVRLPLLASEVCASAMTFPWRWRVNRRLVLRLVAQLSPRLSAIPNDKQEPMRVLDWGSWPWYAAAGVRSGSKAARRLVRAYLGRPAGGITATAPRPPASWRARLGEGKHVTSVVEPNLISAILTEVGSNAVTPDAVRAFYTLLTLELLLAGVRGLSKRLDFTGSPPPLVP